jgi:hypothetical protein
VLITKDTEGSVLLEALAALAIISGAVVMGLNGFVEASARLKRSEDRLTALALARNLITETIGSATSVPSESEGVTNSGLAWSIKVYQEFAREQTYLVKPYRLVVTVARREAAPLVVLETTGIALEQH